MHIAIVSYTFPPSKEIGGRRWSKFCKYITAKGHEVTVVCADNFGTPDWYVNEFPGVDVRVLPRRYPDWLSGYTKSIKEKLLYRFYTRILTLFTKQNFFDRGFAWKSTMLNELEKIHNKKSIEVLVVTGAPFSLLFYGSLFKMRHKEILYVSDLRDPWTWRNYYGMMGLTQLQKKFQHKSEYKTMLYSDMVCYPNEIIGEFLQKKYPFVLSKLYQLAHAYEPEKFQNIQVGTRKGFIYGGALYDGIEDYIKRLIEIIKKNSDSKFKWDIYTGTNYPMLDAISIDVQIQKHDFIPEEELFRRISNSAAYLAFFPPSDKDILSTKFFEIINTQTPILYIGEEGEVGKFIRESRVGVHILPENMEHELPQYLNGNVPFEKGYFDVSNYTFTSVTDKFLEKVKNLKK